MLGKLIKHEFTATSRMLSILFGVLLVISPITALYMKLRNTSLLSDNNLFFNLLEILCMAVFCIAMIAAGITTVIVILNRFYQSMVTRESYLTHTLPVSTSQLIISKLTVAFIWQIIGILVMSVSLRIFIGILGGWDEFSRGFRGFIIYMTDELGFNSGNLSLLIIATIVSIIVAYLKCYAAFALGHLINGHPFLGFIVSYIGISIITQIVSIVALTLFNFIMTNLDTNNESFSTLFNVSIISGLLFNIAWGVLFYIITMALFKKKLNI